MRADLRAGLEGVIATETVLSDVDGRSGRLVIAGHTVQRLAGAASFEQVLALLATGALPETPDAVRVRLGRARAEAFELLPRLGDALDRDDPMTAVLAALAHAALGDGRDAVDTACRASGALATFTGTWWQRRRGLAPLAPDPSLAHAADVLRLVRGEAPERAESDALDTYLVTVVDHGLNASTFAARVVASTGSDAGSALVAAIGALKGPLHGGAPGPVLEMLQRIGRPEAARAFLERELAEGRRIMGMGHRVYRVRDPRADVLERAARRLERELPSRRVRERLSLARAVEREAETLLAARHPARPLPANVEFYTAVLLDALGIPAELFSNLFAIARSAGWAAHVAEQLAHGRLIRPASRYVGPQVPVGA